MLNVGGRGLGLRSGHWQCHVACPCATLHVRDVRERSGGDPVKNTHMTVADNVVC